MAVAVGVAVAVVVLAYGCSGTRHGASTAAAAAPVGLVSGRDAELQLASGVVVNIPGSTVVAAGTLSGSEASPPSSAPGGLAFAGPVYRFQATPASLSGPVTLTFPVPAATGTPAGPNNALLASYDTATEAWTPVPATYDATSHLLTATEPLAPIWAVLRLNAATLIPAVTSALERYIGLAAATATPTCAGRGQLAADGVKVTSDTGLLVRWCAGLSPTGTPMLIVADSRAYPLEADYPAGWSSHLLGPTDPVLQQIVTSVAAHLPATSRDVSSVIIPGGASVEIDAPLGATGTVTAVASLQGYLIDTLVFAADTLVTTLGDIPVPAAPRPDSITTARAVALAFESKDCLHAFDPLANSDIFTAPTAGGIGQLFGSGVTMAFGCLAVPMTDAYRLAGSDTGFAAGALLWLVTGIKSVLNRAREPVDNDLLVSSYRISLASGGTPAP